MLSFPVCRICLLPESRGVPRLDKFSFYFENWNTWYPVPHIAPSYRGWVTLLLCALYTMLQKAHFLSTLSASISYTSLSNFNQVCYLFTLLSIFLLIYFLDFLTFFYVHIPVSNQYHIGLELIFIKDFFLGGGVTTITIFVLISIFFFHWGRVLYHPFASVTIYAILEFIVDVKKNKISALTDIFVAYWF